MSEMLPPSLGEMLTEMVERDEVVVHAVLVLDVLEPTDERNLRARTYSVTTWEARGMLRDADSLLANQGVDDE